MGKAYYPYLDLLKFLCCVGVVAIHTQPQYYLPMPIKEGIFCILDTMVPIFFIISAYLLSQKLNGESDWSVIWKFVCRLAILYSLWTIIMLPEWLPGFIKHNPGDWIPMLPLKVLLRGGPHGSWFIVSLIYGTIIACTINRFIGHKLTTLCFFVLATYISLINAAVIPDFVKLQSLNNSVIEINFSPLNALLYIQLGFMLHWSKWMSKISIYVADIQGGGRLCLFVLAIVFPIFSPHEIHRVCDVIPELLIVSLCLRQYKVAENFNPYVVLRKMSIIIYFSHFAFATGFRYLYEHGYIDHEYGLREFAVAIIACCLISYTIVQLSGRYKVLRYLY